MNKKMLLAGAAVFALTVASTANATGVILAGDNGSVQIHPTVDLVGSFTLTKDTDLKFGIIMNATGSQTVTIASNGAVSGTAHLIGQAIDASTPQARTSQTVSAGQFTVGGNVATLLARTEDVHDIAINMPASVILTADGAANGTVCGTVTITTPSINVTQAGAYTYGGTFTVDANLQAADYANGLKCAPKAGENVNVTLVLTEGAQTAQAPANP